jgi:hypothetical protein
MKGFLKFVAAFALAACLGCDQSKNPMSIQDDTLANGDIAPQHTGEEAAPKGAQGQNGSENQATIEITYSATGFGSVTYFSGQVQESVVNFTGSNPTAITLEEGVPFAHRTHAASFDVGVNDGTFPGPSEIRKIKTTITISYQKKKKTVTKTVTLAQEARFFQISNDQFQFEIGPSKTKRLRLDPLGFLDLTAQPVIFQLRANSSGSGAHFRTEFLLHKAK